MLSAQNHIKPKNFFLLLLNFSIILGEVSKSAVIERRRQELKSLAMAAKNNGDKVSLADFFFCGVLCRFSDSAVKGAKLLYEPFIHDSLRHGCNRFSILTSN